MPLIKDSQGYNFGTAILTNFMVEVQGKGCNISREVANCASLQQLKNSPAKPGAFPYGDTPPPGSCSLEG